MAYVSIPQAALLLALLYFGQLYVRAYLAERRFQRFAREQGCQPVHVSINKLPWGVDRFLLFFKFKGDFLDGLIFARFKNEGVWTYYHTSLFGNHVVHTAEPRNVQALLATSFKDFEIGDIRHKQFGPLLGYGIFTSDGPAWEHFRALLKPQFSREQISDLDAIERHLQRLFAVLRTKDDGWTEDLDLEDSLNRFTLDVATEFLYGRSVNSQLAALNEKASIGGETAGDTPYVPASAEEEFSTAFNVSQKMLLWRIRMQDLYWLMNSKEFRKACAICRHFIDDYVAIALDPKRLAAEKAARVADGSKEKYVLLDALAETTQNPNELRDQLLQILTAGRDTTASTLSFALLLLGKHPEVWREVRDEVLGIFGPEEQGDEITFAKLKSARYLQYVINETLRLYPVAPLNNRFAVRDTVLPVGGGPDGKGPVAVRKGTLVNFSDYVIHRREDLWGEDALDWKPERWINRKHGWEYLPFNGGPRVCMGRK